MKQVDKAPEAPIEFERANERPAGVVLSVAGTALVGVGFKGIDSHEAATPEEAIASTYFGDTDIFITSADIGFGAVMGVGVAIGAVGVRKLFNRKPR